MKYLTALLSSIFVFLGVWLLSGLALSFVLPSRWWEIEIGIGLVRGNIPGIAAGVFGAIAATYTFKASLHAKTGRLYRKKNASA
jgi:hypothetical protein